MESIGASVTGIALRVADSEAAADFYDEVVGLERLGVSDGRVQLGTGETGPVVELEEAPDAPRRDPTEAGLFHLAIRFPDRESLAEALGRIERRKHPLAGGSDHYVSEALYTADPAGNGVELYADRPASEWRCDAEGEVVMTTKRLDLDDLRSASGDDPVEAAPAGTDLGHVHLEVTDLEAAVGFYCDDLGMEVQARRRGAAFVSYGGYHHHVGLNTWNRRTEPKQPNSLGVADIFAETDAAQLSALKKRANTSTGSDGDLELRDPDGVGWTFRGSN